MARVRGSQTFNSLTNFSSGISINVGATTQAGSVGGTADFYPTERGNAFKKVIIYLTAFNGTTTYIYPDAFTNTPVIMTTTGGGQATGVTLTITDVTRVTVTTGSNTTGMIILEGF